LCPGYRTLGGMEIIIEVVRSAEGPLTGTVRPVDSTERRDFYGVMELLACLERFIDVDASAVPEAATTKENRP
jgi:hypothetical protein